MRLEDWRTDADENVSAAKVLIAFLVYLLLVLAFLGDILLVWAARP